MSFEDAKQKVDALWDSMEGFGPDWNDLENLYGLLMERGARTILEFGSGFSTLVIWQAQHDLGFGNAFSLEGDPYFYSNMAIFSAKRGLLNPQTEFKDMGRYLLFSPVVSTAPDRMDYSYLPLSFFEFVYVDGPALIGEARCLDTLWKLHPRPFTILVDGRARQCKEIQTRAGAFYDMEIDKENSRTLFTIHKNAIMAPITIDHGGGFYD